MGESGHDVTDAELAVMQALWQRGEATTRQLKEDLYPGGSSAHYGTVQKLLERLEAKGYVRRDRRPYPHRFTALVGRAGLISRSLRSLAERLCGGSLTPLLNNLLDPEHLSARERRELRAFLEKLTPPESPAGGSERTEP